MNIDQSFLLFFEYWSNFSKFFEYWSNFSNFFEYWSKFFNFFEYCSKVSKFFVIKIFYWFRQNFVTICFYFPKQKLIKILILVCFVLSNHLPLQWPTHVTKQFLSPISEATVKLIFDGIIFWPKTCFLFEFSPKKSYFLIKNINLWEAKNFKIFPKNILRVRPVAP